MAPQAMRVAVDTNVLVRLLVDDGSAQRAAADRIARDCHLVVAPTALLETEWVLRSAIGLSPQRIAEGFMRLLGLSTMTFLQRDAVDAALKAFQSGCDFADALHAASAAPVDAFMTFDKAFVRRARSLDYLPAVQRLDTGTAGAGLGGGEGAP